MEWGCAAVTFGFALTRPSGSPVTETNVKIKKLAAIRTGTL
jgi:hypothetical protein